MTLKRHGKWSSDTVAESYVADSKKSKLSVCSIFSSEKVIALEKALVMVKFLTIVPSATEYLTLNSKLLMHFLLNRCLNLVLLFSVSKVSFSVCKVIFRE